MVEHHPVTERADDLFDEYTGLLTGCGRDGAAHVAS
jgi:hypothetical protein